MRLKPTSPKGWRSSGAESPRSRPSASPVPMPERLSVGLSLSLSGAYAPMGRQAEAAIKLFVDDLNAAGGVSVGGRARKLTLRCYDDQSDERRCAEIFS